MKLFVDTAKLDEIEPLLKAGIIDGITTNPSLVAKVPKTQGDFLDRYVSHMRKISELCRKYNSSASLSVEVFTENPREMVEQARDLNKKIDYENLAIKIPAPFQDSDGLSELVAVKTLNDKGLNVNYTCCFSSSQLINGAKAGARYVSLFYNRLIDFYKTFSVPANPLDAIRDTRKFLDNADLPSKTEIIAGSIRYPRDITDCWKAGAHIATAGYQHIINMNKHPKTDESVKGFSNDLKGWMENE